jgi:hypothetical protein
MHTGTLPAFRCLFSLLLAKTDGLIHDFAAFAAGCVWTVWFLLMRLKLD